MFSLNKTPKPNQDNNFLLKCLLNQPPLNKTNLSFNPVPPSIDLTFIKNGISLNKFALINNVRFDHSKTSKFDLKWANNPTINMSDSPTAVPRKEIKVKLISHNDSNNFSDDFPVEDQLNDSNTSNPLNPPTSYMIRSSILDIKNPFVKNLNDTSALIKSLTPEKEQKFNPSQFSFPNKRLFTTVENNTTEKMKMLLSPDFKCPNSIFKRHKNDSPNTLASSVSYQRIKSIHRIKKFKKDKNTYLVLNDSAGKVPVLLNYEYLFENFSDNFDGYSQFDNDKIKPQYIKYFTYGKSNLNKLTFRSSPLDNYQNLISWYDKTSEDEKELQSEIKEEVCSINEAIAKIPIFPASREIRLYKKRNRVIRKQGREYYSCSLCEDIFANPQGLGGHMSRKHKDQSVKYQTKKEIWKQREPIRKQNLLAKIAFCREMKLNYEVASKTREGKKSIRQLIQMNKHTFNRILKQISDGEIKFD